MKSAPALLLGVLLSLQTSSLAARVVSGQIYLRLHSGETIELSVVPLAVLGAEQMARTEMAHGNAITAALLAVEHKKQAVEKAKIALIEAEASSEQAREMYLAALDLSSSVGNDAEKAKLYAEFQAAESGIAPAKEAIRDTNLSLKVAIETANALKRDLLRFIPKDSLMSSTNSRGMFRITAPSEALFLIAELERQIGGKTEESRWMVSIPAGSADVEIDLNNLNLNK